MVPILSILVQAFMAGLALSCIYFAGAFGIKSRDHAFTNYFSQKIASGIWLFISGFVDDLVTNLILA